MTTEGATLARLRNLAEIRRDEPGLAAVLTRIANDFERGLAELGSENERLRACVNIDDISYGEESDAPPCIGCGNPADMSRTAIFTVKEGPIHALCLIPRVREEARLLRERLEELGSDRAVERALLERAERWLLWAGRGTMPDELRGLLREVDNALHRDALLEGKGGTDG